MITHLGAKQVQTRAPHRCFGCRAGLPPSSSARAARCGFEGHAHPRDFCAKCQELLKTVDWADDPDGMFEGDLAEHARAAEFNKKEPH